MLSLCGRIVRGQVDPVYFLLESHARLRRRQHVGQHALGRTAARGAATCLRWGHGLYRALSASDDPRPWLTEDDARRATQERDELLDALAGRIQLGARGSKPHTGPLSPGCEICQNGDWGCSIINRRCTRDCFFCKRHHSVKVEPDPETDGYTFATPAEHVEFIRTFGVKGIGFSGGEPLLVVDRVLSHIEAVRREFGDAIYLWMYTNGDLVDHDIMRRLREAGLDEIRFNLSAREYDTAPVLTAREHIPTVTVEIPAIPEHFERLKDLLVEMQSIGVDYLNLHELTVESQNWRPLRGRGYHVDCSTGLSIIESEMCALRLLQHACDEGLRLPINYCSTAYKNRFQKRGWRMRQARAALHGSQEITGAGLIRSLVASGAAHRIGEIVRRMESDGCDTALWKVDPSGTALTLHGSLAAYADGAALTAHYHQPGVAFRNRAAGCGQANLIPSHRPIAGVAVNSWPDAARSAELARYEELPSGLPEMC